MCTVLPFIFRTASPGDFCSAVFCGVGILGSLVATGMNSSLSQPRVGGVLLPTPPPASPLKEAPGRKACLVPAAVVVPLGLRLAWPVRMELL